MRSKKANQHQQVFKFETGMKQFQSDMKAKAHLRKIKNAKTTMDTRKSRMGAQRPTQPQDVMLLRLYEANQMSSIPIYKLLKQLGLQQYTKELIIRGYGVNIGKLAYLNDLQRDKLFEQIKVMPGHSTKLKKLIDLVASSSKEFPNTSSYSKGSLTDSNSIFQKNTRDQFMIELDDRDDYEKQLERVLNQYTPKDTTHAFKKDARIKNARESSRQAKKQTPKQPSVSQIKDHNRIMMKTNIQYPTSGKIQLTKKVQESVKRISVPNDKNEKKSTVARFSAKDISSTATKATVKKEVTHSGATKKQISSLKSLDKMKDRAVLEVQLKIDRVKALFLSVDGAIMTSTILNLDLQEQCHCLAGYLQGKIKVADRKKIIRQHTQEAQGFEKQDLNQEDVSSILRQSYLHPLYRNQQLPPPEDLAQTANEIEQQIDRQPQPQGQQQQNGQIPLDESSFMGCNDSVSFGLSNKLDIFEELYPAEVDYYIPTVDSLANFVKNVVISAKMERQVPILSILYMEKFLAKTNMLLTSLNYKRLLISCLLLASKVWDDESFQTPSFSHTFPDYPTVLLNELQKQILIAINYELKLNKKDYTLLYYKLRQLRQPAGKSYQNRAINIVRVRDLQKGANKIYRSDCMTKRKSF